MCSNSCLDPPLDFFPVLSMWLPITKFHFRDSKSGSSYGFLVFCESKFHPKFYIYGFPTRFHSSREFLGVFHKSKCGFFPSCDFCNFHYWEYIAILKLMSGCSIMDRGWYKMNSHEEKWLIGQVNHAHTQPNEFLSFDHVPLISWVNFWATILQN